MHEMVTGETSEELIKATEEEQKSACGPSTKNMKNKDLLSETIKNEGNEPDVCQHQKREDRKQEERYLYSRNTCM